MKLSAVIVSRNDNYGGHLKERATLCLNSFIETFDEVWYIDWNSPTHSLIWDIEKDLNLKGNLNHICITPEVASILTSNDPQAQVCNEVLGRNLGISRSTGDFIVSSNIDIICPKRQDLEDVINNIFEPNTFYTISRRHTTLEDIKSHQGGEIDYKNWMSMRDKLIETSSERTTGESIIRGDDYSIINCCGDFQIASKEVWNEIRGFEEDLIYTLYSDTNVQKKAVKHGFGLKALYSPSLFHIYHGKGGGGFLDGVNKKVNDMYRAIINQNKTENQPTWGFKNTEIEYETI